MIFLTDLLFPIYKKIKYIDDIGVRVEFFIYCLLRAINNHFYSFIQIFLVNNLEMKAKLFKHKESSKNTEHKYAIHDKGWSIESKEIKPVQIMLPYAFTSPRTMMIISFYTHPTL